MCVCDSISNTLCAYACVCARASVMCSHIHTCTHTDSKHARAHNEAGFDAIVALSDRELRAYILQPVINTHTHATHNRTHTHTLASMQTHTRTHARKHARIHVRSEAHTRLPRMRPYNNIYVSVLRHYLYVCSVDDDAAVRISGKHSRRGDLMYARTQRNGDNVFECVCVCVCVYVHGCVPVSERRHDQTHRI